MFACGWPPMIATDRQRKTSFTKARMDGKSSSDPGLRYDPTTRSNSSHALGNTSGNAQHARTKVIRVELDVSLPAPKRLPFREAISKFDSPYFGASSMIFFA